MKDKKQKIDTQNVPLVSMSAEDRDDFWDSVSIKEEGVILDFDHDTKTGSIKSLEDGQIYSIDCREDLKTNIELRPGDKVLFAPVENSARNDYAQGIKILELNC